MQARAVYYFYKLLGLSCTSKWSLPNLEQFRFYARIQICSSKTAIGKLAGHSEWLIYWFKVSFRSQTHTTSSTSLDLPGEWQPNETEGLVIQHLGTNPGQVDLASSFSVASTVYSSWQPCTICARLSTPDPINGKVLPHQNVCGVRSNHNQAKMTN